MGQYNLNRIFRPRHVAVVGASEKTVHGIVLHENRNMLALGKKLGFEIKRDADSADNELVIRFEGNPP